MSTTIEVTGLAQQKAWGDKLMPPVEEVRPGLWSIPVPLPNNPLRYVLVYALELDSGVAIVDAGWDTEDAWAALNAGLETAGGSITDVRAVLVTHNHADHFGLAGRVRSESGAWIGLHPEDAAVVPSRYADPSVLLANMREMLTDWGVPDILLDQLNRASMGIREQVGAVQPDVLFVDGAPVNIPGWDLRVIWTPGHSPGHVCFYSESRSLLLAGDHVLPRITPAVGVHTQQHANPLADFLQSQLKVRELRCEEVLPAHEYRFAGLDRRVDEIIAHHAARMGDVEEIIGRHPGTTAWEVALKLNWARPWNELPFFMQRSAAGEAVAHIVILEIQDRVRREGGLPSRFFLNPDSVY